MSASIHSTRFTHDIHPDPPLTGDALHAARLNVCAHATDADDARNLLEAFGLLDYDRNLASHDEYGRWRAR
jgi:hypothetical protein